MKRAREPNRVEALAAEIIRCFLVTERKPVADIGGPHDDVAECACAARVLVIVHGSRHARGVESGDLWAPSIVPGRHVPCLWVGWDSTMSTNLARPHHICAHGCTYYRAGVLAAHAMEDARR